MSILGYSASYFLPEYWVNTPLYGEKIIPLLDYILSTDYVNADTLAIAFYNIESKYKNTADLPIEQIEAIIEESGYGYIRNMLGQDEDSLRLLVYTLVMVHQLKGSKKGVETVLNLLKSPGGALVREIVGDLTRTEGNEVSGFSPTAYVKYTNLNLGLGFFELTFKITTSSNFNNLQCIACASDYGFYLGIDYDGHLVLRIGEKASGLAGRTWQEINGSNTFVSDRILLPNTTYTVVLTYSNGEYSLRVSTDEVRYDYFLAIPSSTPLDINEGAMYLGIDHSTSINDFTEPYEGSIFLGPLTVSSNDVKVTQWFETYPVGDENTFEVESALDGDLISASFFENFAKFLANYVYPTLKAFKARLLMRGKLTFVPYVRSRVTYVAGDNSMRTNS